MGSHWLSGTPVRGDHSEDSPPEEGCHGEISVGSLLLDTSGRNSCADPACHHCMGSLIALHPGPLSPQCGWPVRAAFSARRLCYILNSARKMSILNLR